MTEEKFDNEINTLKKFFEYYCKQKDTNQQTTLVQLEYKNRIYSLDLDLCPKCLEKITYSFERLQSCPHEIKPRCRNCPSPCYGKQEWKNIAKIMVYSAPRLGLSKIKSKIKESVKNSISSYLK